MHSDDYRELLENARDALRDLLRGSEPGTGLLLHTAYSQINESIETGGEIPQRRETDAERQHREIEEQMAVTRERWSKQPAAEKMHIVLNALGEDRLTASEVAERVTRDLELGRFKAYGSETTHVLKRLLDAGEVRRVSEPRAPGSIAMQWRWFRTPADGSQLAALERQLDDAGQEPQR